MKEKYNIFGWEHILRSPQGPFLPGPSPNALSVSVKNQYLQILACYTSNC